VVNLLPEAAERHPGEADRARQERGRGLSDRFREREGTHRSGVEVGRGWKAKSEFGAPGTTRAGGLYLRICGREVRGP